MGISSSLRHLKAKTPNGTACGASGGDWGEFKRTRISEVTCLPCLASVGCAPDGSRVIPGPAVPEPEAPAKPARAAPPVLHAPAVDGLGGPLCGEHSSVTTSSSHRVTCKLCAALQRARLSSDADTLGRPVHYKLPGFGSRLACGTRVDALTPFTLGNVDKVTCEACIRAVFAREENPILPKAEDILSAPDPRPEDILSAPPTPEETRAALSSLLYPVPKLVHLYAVGGVAGCGAAISADRSGGDATTDLVMVSCAACIKSDLYAANSKREVTASKLSKSRPSWDHYFISIAEAVAARGTCDRKKVGAVLVAPTSAKPGDHAGRILATGYNGALPGMPSCDEAGHDFAETLDPLGVPQRNCVRTVHAEMNAVASAARFGVALGEPCATTCYVNTYPCWPCFRALVTAGVGRIVFRDLYRPDRRIQEAAAAMGITLEQLGAP